MSALELLINVARAELTAAEDFPVPIVFWITEQFATGIPEPVMVAHESRYTGSQTFHIFFGS